MDWVTHVLLFLCAFLLGQRSQRRDLRDALAQVVTQTAREAFDRGFTEGQRHVKISVDLLRLFPPKTEVRG